MNRVTRAACFIPFLLSTDIIVFINEIVHLWGKGEIGLFIVLHLGKIEDGERMKYIRVKYIRAGFVSNRFRLYPLKKIRDKSDSWNAAFLSPI